MKRWPMLIMGVALALGVTACAYFAARLSLKAFREQASEYGLTASAVRFMPVWNGTLYRDVILHHEQVHELFIVAPEVHSRGWGAPDTLLFEKAAFHFFGPWYAMPTGVIERAEVRQEEGKLRFTCELSAPDLVLDHKDLDETPIRLRNVHMTLAGYIDRDLGIASVEEGLLRIGDVRIDFKLAQATGPGPVRADLTVRMDDAEGPALAASLLRLPLLRIGEPALDGKLSIALMVRVDEEKPETSSVRARVSNDLVIRNLPAGYDVASIRKKFSWDVYDAYGGSIRHESGADLPGWISAADTPPHLAAAIIMGVDPQFSEHKGISDLALSAALTDRLKNRRRGGGYATISQRVAEILWPRNGPSVRCGIERALLATHLESTLSKDDLLEIFLNSAPWGQGRYGLHEAARYLVGKSPGELAPEESALIAVAMTAPKRIVVDETGAARPDARADTIDLLNALYRGGLLGDEGLRTAEAAVNRTWWPLTVTRPANASDVGPVMPEAAR